MSRVASVTMLAGTEAVTLLTFVLVSASAETATSLTLVLALCSVCCEAGAESATPLTVIPEVMRYDIADPHVDGESNSDTKRSPGLAFHP